MSMRVLRIRVQGTLMTVAAAVLTTTLKPHDQGIRPYPIEQFTIAKTSSWGRFAKLTTGKSVIKAAKGNSSQLRWLRALHDGWVLWRKREGYDA